MSWAHTCDAFLCLLDRDGRWLTELGSCDRHVDTDGRALSVGSFSHARGAFLSANWSFLSWLANRNERHRETKFRNDEKK
jgi:hypothetical protein